MSQKSTTTYQLLELQPSSSPLVTVIVTVVIAVVAILRVVTKEQVLYIPGHANQSNISVYKLDHYKCNMSKKSTTTYQLLVHQPLPSPLVTAVVTVVIAVLAILRVLIKDQFLFKPGHANQ